MQYSSHNDKKGEFCPISQTSLHEGTHLHSLGCVDPPPLPFQSVHVHPHLS